MPSPTRDRRILWNRQGINYLLLDRFTTAATAPLTSPRKADTAGGSANIVDTANKLTISGGKLQFDQNANTWGDPCLIGPGQSRKPGRAMFGVIKHQNATTQDLAGWVANGASNNGQAYGAVYFNVGALSARVGLGAAVATDSYVLLVPYRVCSILRSAGSFTFVKGGAFLDWTLVWVDNTDNAATVYPAFSNRGNAGSFDDFAVVDVGGPFTTDYGFATSYSATTSAGQTATQTANALVEWTFTAQTGVTKELRFNWTDDNNCWILRADQGASLLSLIEKNGGVETVRGTALTQTFTNGTNYRIVARRNGNALKTFVNYTAGPVYASGTFNASVTGVKVSHAGGTLAAWPLTTTYLNSYEISQGRFMTIGDSKTDGTGDSTPPALSFNGYPPLLTDLLKTATGQPWSEMYRMATGGWKVSNVKANIDTTLAQITDTPDFVIINIGVNDLTGGTLQASFESDLGYVLDALHTKWPGTRVYVARVWLRGTDATALDNTWIPDVLATRSSWAFAGIDERVVLENGDNGTTLTADGTHPNRAGYTAEATAWKTALGY